MDKILH